MSTFVANHLTCDKQPRKDQWVTHSLFLNVSGLCPASFLFLRPVVDPKERQETRSFCSMELVKPSDQARFVEAVSSEFENYERTSACQLDPSLRHDHFRTVARSLEPEVTDTGTYISFVFE